MDTRKAICLISGGIDSATCLAMARDQGFACHALTFEYGQRHACELDAAARVARSLGAVDQKTIRIDLRTFGGSALTDDIDVPKDRNLTSVPSDCHRCTPTDIPITYVPARNTIFLSYALAYAEVVGAWDLFIGVNAVDYSGYPDCRPEYIGAFERMANLAIKAAVEGKGRVTIHTPLISMTKADIIRRGVAFGVDYGLTHSCYDPDAQGRACGHCDSCRIRRAGFRQAGIEDPTPYAL